MKHILSNMEKIEVVHGCCEESHGAPMTVPTGGVIVSTIGRKKGRLGTEDDAFEASSDQG